MTENKMEIKENLDEEAQINENIPLKIKNSSLKRNKSKSSKSVNSDME